MLNFRRRFVKGEPQKKIGRGGNARPAEMETKKKTKREKKERARRMVEVEGQPDGQGLGKDPKPARGEYF